MHAYLSCIAANCSERNDGLLWNLIFIAYNYHNPVPQTLTSMKRVRLILHKEMMHIRFNAVIH